VDLIWEVDLGRGDARARGGALDDFGDLRIAVHRVSQAAIPPTKLLPPVAVLRGGFSDEGAPGKISLSKELVEYFLCIFVGAYLP
jgi:hypothetical protein